MSRLPTDFTATEAKRLRGVIVSAMVLGAANSLVVTLVSHGLDQALVGAHSARLAAAYLVFLSLALLAFRRQRLESGRLVADHVARLRARIVRGLLTLDLERFERIERARLAGVLSADARLVSDAIQALNGVLMLTSITVFVMVYLLWLSAGLFWMISLLIAGIAALLGLSLARLWHREQRAEATDRRFRTAARALLEGGTELMLNDRRRRAFLGETLGAAAKARRAGRVAAGDGFTATYVAADTTTLLVSAAIVLLLPLVEPVAGALVVQAGIIALSIPVAIVLEFPILQRAVGALARMHALAAELTAAAPAAVAPAAAAPAAAARPPASASAVGGPQTGPPALALDAVTFSYADATGRPGFGVGPLSVHLPAGRVTFIVGGNGSGKSTFLKLLMGLYTPADGRVLVDGVPADAAARRRLMTAVFADTHLFPRLYGYRDTASDRVNGLLEWLEIGDKVSYRNGRFSTLKLSTGQKKRVAMAVALIEDKPVFLFDEWAADQDPAFRERFYVRLLPWLRDQGKTIVAVSHDDRYFRCADQVVQMDFGRVRETWKPDPAPMA